MKPLRMAKANNKANHFKSVHFGMLQLPQNIRFSLFYPKTPLKLIRQNLPHTTIPDQVIL